MKTLKSTLILLLALVAGSAWADGGYTVYPIPHEQVAGQGTASFTHAVSIVAESGIDEYTRNRAIQVLADRGLQATVVKKAKSGQSTIYLGVNGSGGVADKMASRKKLRRDVFQKEKYDRHIVSLTAEKGRAQVVILGENTDAAFYGLATLEQMLDRGTKSLPCATFYDYADVQNRGVIEGYYGVPYSMEVTADLFRFMARYKLNAYMYGAKSDPYHSRYWDKAYPEKITDEERRLGLMTQDMLCQLTDVAHQTKVNFIWAIHPGQSFTSADSKDVLDRIMSKFEKMYELGVRQFGVFVDDVGVPDDEPTLKLGAERLAQLQGKIDKKWNFTGAAPADTVKPLQYVPQLYAFSWVSKEKARKFWESLRPVPAKVNIYTTGKNVWSVPNSSDLDVLHDYLGREVSWWWNYPCNDNDMTKIFPADTYSNFADEKHIANDARLEKGLRLKTIIINPMQQGEISKIALFSVADYTWNMNAFDNQTSWEASLPAVVGRNRADAFKTLVPYLRHYDAQTPLAQLISNFKAAFEKGSAAEKTQASAALTTQLKRLGEACDVVATMQQSHLESDSLFYADLRPWLLKLKSMTTQAQTMLRALQPDGEKAVGRIDFAKSWSAIEGMEKNEQFQFDVLNGLGSDIKLSVLTAEPAAKSLRPFLNWLLEQQE